MADIKETTKGLYALKTYLASKAIEEHGPARESLIGMQKVVDSAVNMLKEQEAKSVIVTTNAYGTRFYHCQRCNRDLYAYPRQLYCSNCGQELKWE